MELKIYLFGGLRVVLGSRHIERFRTQRTASLLAYLAYHQGKPHSRELLAELLWPESDLAAARHSLRMALSSLRQQLSGFDAPESLRVDRQQVNLASGVWVDAVRWRQGLEVAGRTADPDEQLRRLRAAVALYTGPLLQGLYDEWVLEAQETASHRQQQALRQLIRLHQRRGEPDVAVAYARQLAEMDPLSEDGCAELMHALKAAGRAAEAARAYRGYEAALQRELGCSPPPQLVRLLEQVRETADAAPPLPLTPPARPRAERRELRSTPVPRYLTTFVGRNHERAALEQWFARVKERLLVVVGVGGMGKSRLLAEFLGQAGLPTDLPVIWQACSLIRDAEGIAGALLDALSLPRPVSGRPLSALQTALGERHALVVLDNFEHLLPEGAGVVRTLLEELPGVRLMITSRRALCIPGERVLEVLPLATPDLAGEEADPSESARLFLERTNRNAVSTEDSTAVREICTRTAGLPLAIELVAAHGRNLSPTALLAEMDRLLVEPAPNDGEDWRHNSLRKTLDWSRELAPEEVVSAWARLSLLGSQWSLEAAQAVLGGVSRRTALERHSQLQMHSLVSPQPSHSEPRFSMLDPIREYGLTLLEDAARDAALSRLLDWACEHCRDLEQRLDGQGGSELIWRIERDYPTLRTALDWAISHSPAAACDLSGHLWKYWWTRGRLEEGTELLERALDGATTAEDPVRARALYGLGALAWRSGNHALAAAVLDEALQTSQRCGYRRGEAFSLMVRGVLSIWQSGAQEGEHLSRRAAELFAELGDTWGQAAALDVLCLALSVQLRFAEARAVHTESYALFRSISDSFGMGSSVGNLGNILLAEGRYAAAADRLREAQHLLTECGYEYGRRLAACHRIAAHFAAGEITRLDKKLVDELGAICCGADSAVQLFCLDTAALLLCGFGSTGLGPGMLQACDRFRDQLGIARMPVFNTLYTHGLTTASERGLIPDEIHVQNLHEALELALTSLRAIAASEPAQDQEFASPPW